MTADPLLQLTGIAKYFKIATQHGFTAHTQTVKAVDGIGLTVGAGETVGLVGESGCGKSTVSRVILRLTEATAGSATFNGADLLAARGERLRNLRKSLGIVFQDPYSALDPRMMIGDSVAEPLRAHGLARSRRDIEARTGELLQVVGLGRDLVRRYPHEFSGGQRQRIGIARAIATDPQLVVLDEPISALDISIRAQVLNLLQDLKEQRGLAYLFIAHDLATVRHFCDRVYVMYLGAMMEHGKAEQLFAAPSHPYTQALLRAAPVAEPGRRSAVAPIEGDVPSPVDMPSGCRFRTRCPLATEICAQQTPLLREISAGQMVACHHAELALAEAGTLQPGGRSIQASEEQ